MRKVHRPFNKSLADAKKRLWAEIPCQGCQKPIHYPLDSNRDRSKLCERCRRDSAAEAQAALQALDERKRRLGLL